ncbi:hypothetical protein RJ640_019244 [Escallonia rubra]|uniref:Uncharacterized protein n=1 Tax=Escallonia rubra TaxID=112253 RepID=A0AA88UI59_9ASTE|nr:hypothetical protein RJ640_019244 [Escallonia rubra]
MSEDFTGSPYRRHRDGDDGNSGPFDIVRTKSASIDPLKRWRQAALALNASRRFRYTLHLKKEEEKKQIIAKIRTHAQVIRAAYLLQSRITAPGTPKSPPTPMPTGDYDIGPEQLASMTRDHDFTALQHFGGVRGLAEELNTNTERGVHGDESDRLLLDACRDTTLIISMVAAGASLALGIKTEGIKEGLCDGASIAMAVIIVIAVTGRKHVPPDLGFQTVGLDANKSIKHKYYIRTFTVYDNFDGKSHSPSFHLSVEGNLVFSWRSPWQKDVSSFGGYSDLIAFVSDGEADICFYNIATDYPVIASLKLIQIDPASYDSRRRSSVSSRSPSARRTAMSSRASSPTGTTSAHSPSTTTSTASPTPRHSTCPSRATSSSRGARRGRRM